MTSNIPKENNGGTSRFVSGRRAVRAAADLEEGSRKVLLDRSEEEVADRELIMVRVVFLDSLCMNSVFHHVLDYGGDVFIILAVDAGKVLGGKTERGGGWMLLEGVAGECVMKW